MDGQPGFTREVRMEMSHPETLPHGRGQHGHYQAAKTACVNIISSYYLEFRRSGQTTL